MTRSVKEYLRKCNICQKSKTRILTKTLLAITDTPLNAFDRVIVDSIGPLPRTENKSLFNM